MMEILVPPQVQAAADAADKLLADQLLNSEGKADANLEHGKKVVDESLQNQKPEIPEHTGETLESLTKKLEESNQKYSVLQGKYNSEVKALGDGPQVLNDLKADNRDLRRRNTDLERIVSDQQHKLATKTVEPAKPEKITESSIALSDDQKQHLESEGITGKTLDILKDMAAQISKAQTTDITSKVNELSGNVASVGKDVALSKEEKFFQRLTSAVESWRTVNKDEAFLDWLDGKAPYQNRTRQEVLSEASQHLDVDVAAQIFNDFIAQSGVVIDKDTLDTKVDKTLTDEPLTIDPSKLVEIASGGGLEAEKDEPTYTMAEYKKHYDDGTKGIWKGREKEWEEYAAVLDKALVQGRIKQ